MLDKATPLTPWNQVRRRQSYIGVETREKMTPVSPWAHMHHHVTRGTNFTYHLSDAGGFTGPAASLFQITNRCPKLEIPNFSIFKGWARGSHTIGGTIYA